MSQSQYYDDANERSAGTEAWTSQSTGGGKRKWDTARTQLNDAYQTARQKSDEALTQIEGRIRERPLEGAGYAAAIGAAVGLVIGLLLGRRE